MENADDTSPHAPLSLDMNSLPHIEDFMHDVIDDDADVILSSKQFLKRRCLKAGTLPAILRRLTTLQTTSQSEIWTLLLHLRIFSHKKNILEFLYHRFSNDTATANIYAASLCADLQHACSDDIPADPTLAIVDWLFEQRHILGSQVRWLAESEYLIKTSDALSQRAAHCHHNSALNDFATSFPIKAACLMFLETWITEFPEDFMDIKSFGNNFSLTLDDVTDTGVLQASYSSPRLSREGDMLDGLIRFVRTISYHEDMILWGSQPDALREEFFAETPFKLHFKNINYILSIVNDAERRSSLLSMLVRSNSASTFPDDPSDEDERRSRTRTISENLFSDDNQEKNTAYTISLLNLRLKMNNYIVSPSPYSAFIQDPSGMPRESKLFALQTRAGNELYMRREVMQLLREMDSKAMHTVWKKYSALVAAVSALELQAIEDFVKCSNTSDERPMKLFSRPIDKLVLSQSESNGFELMSRMVKESKDEVASVSSSSEEVSEESTSYMPLFSYLRRRSLKHRRVAMPSRSSFGSGKRAVSTSLFLPFTPVELANNLTLRYHYLFCTIPILEFCLNFSFPTKYKANTPMLTRLRTEGERLQRLFVSDILSQDDMMKRAEVISLLIKTGEVLATLRSHHCLMIIVFALQTTAVHRLKHTWKMVNVHMPGRWDILQDLVGFGGAKLVTNYLNRAANDGIVSTTDLREQLFIMNPEALVENKYTALSSSALNDYFDARQTKDKLYFKLNQPVRPPHTHRSDMTIASASSSVQDVQELKKSYSGQSMMSMDTIPVGSAEDHFSSTSFINDEHSFKGNNNHMQVLREVAAGNVESEDASPPRRSRVRSRSFSGEVKPLSADLPTSALDDNLPQLLSSHAVIDETDSIPPAPSRESSYNIITDARPSDKKLSGMVRIDESAAVYGVPKPVSVPCMPYIMGLQARLIRLNEVPDFIKEITTVTNEETNEKSSKSDFLYVQSPGVASSDPRLPMINFGKLSSLSYLVKLIRASQMTPYDMELDIDIQRILLTPALYQNEEQQWERSKHLEK